MRTVANILLVVLVASSIAAAQNVKPSYGFTHTKDVRTDGYDFNLLRAEPDTNHWRMGYFKFRWRGTKSIRLWGFGFEKDGAFRVRFEQFSKMSKGQWEEVQVGYCGTGAEMFTLKPNRDYELQIPLWPYEKGGEEGIVKLDGMNISVISTPFKISDVTSKR